MIVGKTFTLIGSNGRPYQSSKPGSLGGHRASSCLPDKYAVWKKENLEDVPQLRG
jgi:hypothetical protein